jgi:hypothetical protein
MSWTFQEHISLACVAYVGVYKLSIMYTLVGTQSPCDSSQ